MRNGISVQVLKDMQSISFTSLTFSELKGSFFLNIHDIKMKLHPVAIVSIKQNAAQIVAEEIKRYTKRLGYL